MWLARYLEHWHGLREMKHICLHELLGSTSNNSLYKDDNQASHKMRFALIPNIPIILQTIGAVG